MNILPQKKSRTWYLIFGFVFLVNIALLLLSRLLVGQSLTSQNVVGFNIISFMITIFIIPGMFGFEVYVITVFLGNLLALIYMLSLILVRKNDGWVDLTSIFGYLSIVVISIIAGFIAQVVAKYVLKKKN